MPTASKTKEELHQFRVNEKRRIHNWCRRVRARIIDAITDFKLAVRPEHMGTPLAMADCVFFKAAMDGHNLVMAIFYSTKAVLFYRDELTNEIIGLRYNLPDDIKTQIKMYDQAYVQGLEWQIQPGEYTLLQPTASSTREGVVKRRALKDQLENLKEIVRENLNEGNLVDSTSTLAQAVMKTKSKTSKKKSNRRTVFSNTVTRGRIVVPPEKRV